MNITNWRSDLKALLIIALGAVVGNGVALTFILWWRS